MTEGSPYCVPGTWRFSRGSCLRVNRILRPPKFITGSQETVRAAHPGLYTRHQDGFVRVLIREGQIVLDSVNAAPFECQPLLDPTALESTLRSAATYVRAKYLKNTTAVFQLATAVIYVSPFICWPDHPEAYLESPFLPIIRTMPAVWNETQVLDGSVIGRFVAFARRSGKDWYVALLNCQRKEKTHAIELSFLGEGDYDSTLYYDVSASPTSIRVETGSGARKGQTRTVQLNGGGGFVGCFRKPREYTKWRVDPSQSVDAAQVQKQCPQ